jgi:hypothetical protein
MVLVFCVLFTLVRNEITNVSVSYIMYISASIYRYIWYYEFNKLSPKTSLILLFSKHETAAKCSLEYSTLY